MLNIRMDQTKRQNEDDLFVSNKRKNISRIVDVSHSLLRDSNTCFEHLSNDIFYEIFDYLNFVDVHHSFSNLNHRFQRLVNDPNFPIKLNLSLMSSKKLDDYWTNVVLFNQHRIQSLCLTQSSIFIIAYSPISIWSEFTCLKILHFYRIKSKFITSVFLRLRHLSCLTILLIDCFDRDVNNRIIDEQILRLPKLKYCRFSSQSTYSSDPLPLATTTFSSIKSLVFRHCLKSIEINAILSYLPQLRRLSVQCDDTRGQTLIQSHSPMLNRLTHLSLDIKSIQPEQFELMIKNLFNRIEVLRISLEKSVLLLNGNFWQELIESYLPYLRIFDIGIFYSTTSTDQIRLNECHNWMKVFHSSFWSRRQWFFEDHIDQEDYQWYLSVHSSNSFRSKQYASFKKTNEVVYK